MDTYYASPQRASKRDLEIEVQIVNNSPVMSALLHSVSGLLAVLNEQRQVIALNDSFLRKLGIRDSEAALGLRLGETLNCIHAQEEPAGCGTTKYCSTCGAAVAMATSLSDQAPLERLCALTAHREGKSLDIALLVKSQPITLEGQRLLLLLVHDVTVEQRRAALERAFFHDINNLLSPLFQTCEILAEEHPNKLSASIWEFVRRLHGEVAIQRYLSSLETGRYNAIWRSCNVNSVLTELRRFFTQHPAAWGKHLDCAASATDPTLITDIAALFRVLTNMILNALEATENGGTVRVWIELANDQVCFCVWNRAVVPEEIGRRLYQRNFSTKAEAGRGIGTFSMKLLGEDVLGGLVSFTSSESEGTTFRFTHPPSQPAPREERRLSASHGRHNTACVGV